MEFLIAADQLQLLAGPCDEVIARLGAIVLFPGPEFTGELLAKHCVEVERLEALCHRNVLQELVPDAADVDISAADETVFDSLFHVRIERRSGLFEA